MDSMHNYRQGLDCFRKSSDGIGTVASLQDM
jgi:hypothetical protein